MAKLIKRISKKSGLPPGTLVHIGDQKTAEVTVSVTSYNNGDYRETFTTVDKDFSSLIHPESINWIAVNGLHRVDIIERLGQGLNLHSLTIEDIANTGQRPKMDDFSDYLFIVLNDFQFLTEENSLNSEQVSIILKSNTVMTLQEGDEGILKTLKERIRNMQGRIRTQGADYLVYSILDIIIDNYFSIIESIVDKIEVIEESVITNPSENMLENIYTLRKNALILQKSIWPLREIIFKILKGENHFFSKSTITYCKDLNDHIRNITGIINSVMEMAEGIINIYLSSISVKMNRVINILTVITSIFIPITFLSSIYGMNFKYMPELNFKYSYFILLAIMAIVGISMFVFFKRKKWL